PRPLRRPARPGALFPEPHHGRGRGHQGPPPGHALRDAPPAQEHLVRLGTFSGMGRRVLVTGLSTFWGGRLAQSLEKDPDVDVIVGLDTQEPRVELERTEFVKADQSYSILSRIVQATQVDTILHTFLIVDSTRMSGRALHEINVIGTLNLLAAAGAAGSPVRQVAVKSSTLVYGSSWAGAVWFREGMTRTHSGKP